MTSAIALKIKEYFQIQQARGKAVGYRIGVVGGLVLNPGIGERILDAEQIEYFKAGPDAAQIIKITVCRMQVFIAIQQQCGESNVCSFVVGQAKRILI